jgi:transposase InsO family protein
MASVTQDLRFKQAVIVCAQRKGVTYAARKYKTTRQWIYYWLRRYDGTIDSLRERSRRPHSHPNQHTEEELTLIANMRRRNPDIGLVDFWVKLRERGYTRTTPALFRVMCKLGYFDEKKEKKPKYIPKPYESMEYPGQRVQVDVKYVPVQCTKAMGEKTCLYQFTAIDEYSRQRYLEGFEENSSYSAAIFIEHAIRYFKFKIECVQTDNGSEFTKHYQSDNPKPTLFQLKLQEHGIRHKLIKVFTPRHNGKVERSHRKDQERFYNKHSFYSLEDYNKQLRKYNREYNNFPTRPLGWLSPNQYLEKYFLHCVTNV